LDGIGFEVYQGVQLPGGLENDFQDSRSDFLETGRIRRVL
jgi:hypothetical protein